MNTLTQRRLQELLHYDQPTGLFVWLVNRGGRRGARAGSVAGGMSADGYWRIGIDRRDYRANRLAWLFMTGEWPAGEVDHKNLDRSDNSWTNLRDATVSQNRINRARQKNNKSGFKGVRLHAHGHAWEANIRVDGRQIYLGLFATPEEGHAAYVAASERLHGEFARAS